MKFLIEDKADIDLIEDQVRYLNSVKRKIFNEGEAVLTEDDFDTLDKIAQTLASFKIFLISDSSRRE